MVDPKRIVKLQVGHAKRAECGRMSFLLQLRRDAAIGPRDKELSATILPSPPNTILHYVHTPRATNKAIYLLNGYVRMSRIFFKNFGLVKATGHDKQKYVQKNCMSQRSWY
jgi:hypothetical protein